jgi:hypothetical protein
MLESSRLVFSHGKFSRTIEEVSRTNSLAVSILDLSSFDVILMRSSTISTCASISFSLWSTGLLGRVYIPPYSSRPKSYNSGRRLRWWRYGAEVSCIDVMSVLSDDQY